jgi:Tfp pilus assembly pilus retraction ATPase PilT
VRNLIREGKNHQIYSAMQTGGKFGMQTMDAHSVELVRAGDLQGGGRETLQQPRGARAPGRRLRAWWLRGRFRGGQGRR